MLREARPSIEPQLASGGCTQGWLYLASVLDLGSRRVLGYSMADHMRTELVADALTMAAGARGGATDRIIFRGDRGSQYLSGEYRQLITDLGMVQSVGRTGVCSDNSVAEALWSSLKRELDHRYRFPDRASARRAIFAWINRYNQLRLHSSLGYVPPIEWEQHYRQTRPTACRADERRSGFRQRRHWRAIWETSFGCRLYRRIGFARASFGRSGQTTSTRHLRDHRCSMQSLRRTWPSGSASSPT